MSTDRAASPEAETAALRVLEIAANQTVKVIFLGPYKGVLTHYRDGRSSVCTVHDGACALCRTHPQIWCGYAPARFFNRGLSRWQAKVVQITAALEFRLRDRPIRGEVWELRREAKRMRKGDKKPRPGELYGSYCLKLDEGKIGPAFEIEACIRRVLSFSGVFNWVHNDTPERVYIEDIDIDDERLAKVATVSTPPNKEEPRSGESLSQMRERLKAEGMEVL